MVTLNINKLSSKEIEKILLLEINNIVSVLARLKREVKENNNHNPYVKRRIKSSKFDYYVILYFKESDGIIVYSDIGEYVVIYPIEFLLTRGGNEYIFLIKKHAIKRYGERYLHDNEFYSIDEFLSIICTPDFNSKIIIESSGPGVQSVSIRIKDGALLGYKYEVDPTIVRVNTFISDSEIKQANRDDQKILLINR